MKKYVLLLILGIVFFTFACEKEEINPDNDPSPISTNNKIIIDNVDYTNWVGDWIATIYYVEGKKPYTDICLVMKHENNSPTSIINIRYDKDNHRMLCEQTNDYGCNSSINNTINSEFTSVFKYNPNKNQIKVSTLKNPENTGYWRTITNLTDTSFIHLYDNTDKEKYLLVKK